MFCTLNPRVAIQVLPPHLACYPTSFPLTAKSDSYDLFAANLNKLVVDMLLCAHAVLHAAKTSRKLS